MDTDQTPTEPTADGPPPPNVAASAPGPAPAAPAPESPSPATPAPPAGRGGRTAFLGVVVGIVLAVTFSAGIGVGRLATPTGPAVGTTPDPASPAASAPTEFGLIREAWDTLHQQYVARDQISDRALIYGAIEGMTQAIGDTGHTDFMTPEERADRNDALSGSYVGIGVRIDATEEGLPRVVGVFDGSPAETAGLAIDDVILAVDGKSTADSSIDEVATWVRGEAGTSVTLTVRHGADGPERNLTIVRADVPIHPVSWTMVPGTTTAFIRLEQFSSGAADEMVKALKDARAAGAVRVVLDLRGNPGGYVNEAVGVASQFLASGVVYIERNAADERTEHSVTAGGVATDVPLVVIVNGDTASSSEIVSGALQDHGRAKIVGATTFGTGTVLGEFALSDGSALRIGTVEWLTPDGRQIWHNGIAPDVPVTMPTGAELLSPDDVARLTPAAIKTMKDAQLAKALEIVANEAVAGS